MTPDPPVVPSWQAAEWNRHVAQSVVHWCPSCQVHTVPREGACCPCCTPTGKGVAS